jgi:hypothetical protein
VKHQNPTLTIKQKRSALSYALVFLKLNLLHRAVTASDGRCIVSPHSPDLAFDNYAMLFPPMEVNSSLSQENRAARAGSCNHLPKSIPKLYGTTSRWSDTKKVNIERLFREKFYSTRNWFGLLSLCQDWTSGDGLGWTTELYTTVILPYQAFRHVAANS